MQCAVNRNTRLYKYKYRNTYTNTNMIVPKVWSYIKTVQCNNPASAW